MSQAPTNYQQILESEFVRRKQKNLRYSLRAYARDLGILSSRLSEILSGKVGLSTSKASEIAEKLNLDSTTKELFLDLVESKHARSKFAKNIALDRLKQKQKQWKELSSVDFNEVSDWHHLAILEYLELSGSVHTIEAISKALKISAETAQDAITNLEKVNLLEQVDEKWIVKEETTTTSVDVTSENIKKLHSQTIKKSLESLKNDSVETRDFSTAFFKINPKDIDLVKQRIQSFRRSLMEELGKSSEKSSVYSLTIQFFEVANDK